MKIIGLTGGTGSGKGFVSAYLLENGAYVIDADNIAHKIILKGEPAYNEIVDYFGKGILDKEGNIIRKELGKIVFADSVKLEALNSFTHKYVGLEVLKHIRLAKAQKDKYKFIVYDAPLLIDTDFIHSCDEVWSVYADKDVRLKRIMERDGISHLEAEKRIHSQKDWESYKKLSDVILDNSKDFGHIKSQLDDLLAKI